MKPARKQLKQDIDSLYHQIDQDTALLFLIYFCALGVGMTEYVSTWINHAGKRCQETGYQELGQSLIQHAREEAGHELLMHHDTLALTAFINSRYQLHLDANVFLSQTLTQGVLNYKALHEQCINSDTPYGQIAIEYEIEKISIRHGPKLLFKNIKHYGFGLIKCLSFIRSHVNLDILHTQHNKTMLTDFLERHPETLPTLIEYGTHSLHYYSEYLHNCWQLADEHKKLLKTVN